MKIDFKQRSNTSYLTYYVLHYMKTIIFSLIIMALIYLFIVSFEQNYKFSPSHQLFIAKSLMFAKRINQTKNKILNKTDKQTVAINDNKYINVVMTVCGTAVITETMSAIKSIIIFSKERIKFIVFTDTQELRDQLILMFKTLPAIHKSRAYLVLKQISYPEKQNKLKQLVRPCASFRLFLPDAMPEYDSIIFIDSDLLFFDSIAKLWGHFDKMDNKQTIGMVEDLGDWYRDNFLKQHHIVGARGVGAGLMLMNLTRMRESNMTSDFLSVYDDFELRKVDYLGDMGILNEYLGTHPELIQIISCKWDYDDVYCGNYESDPCLAVVNNGISVIHHVGIRSLAEEAQRDKILSVCTHVFDNYRIGTDVETFLLKPLINGFNKLNTKCSKKDYLLKTIKNFVNESSH